MARTSVSSSPAAATLKQQLYLKAPYFLNSKGAISINCPTSVVFCFCINGLFFPPRYRFSPLSSPSVPHTPSLVPLYRPAPSAPPPFTADTIFSKFSALFGPYLTVKQVITNMWCHSRHHQRSSTARPNVTMFQTVSKLGRPFGCMCCFPYRNAGNYFLWTQGGQR